MAFPAKDRLDTAVAQTPYDRVQIVVQIVTSRSQADTARQPYHELQSQGFRRQQLFANQRLNVVQEMSEPQL